MLFGLDRHTEKPFAERVSTTPVTDVVRPRIALVEPPHRRAESSFADLEQQVIVRRHRTNCDAPPRSRNDDESHLRLEADVVGVVTEELVVALRASRDVVEAGGDRPIVAGHATRLPESRGGARWLEERCPKSGARHAARARHQRLLVPG